MFYFRSLCVKVLVADVSELQPHGLEPARLLCPWYFSGQNTGVGSLSLLQGIFPTQGSNPGLLHCRQILHHLSHQGYLIRSPDSPYSGWTRVNRTYLTPYCFNPILGEENVTYAKSIAIPPFLLCLKSYNLFAVVPRLHGMQPPAPLSVAVKYGRVSFWSGAPRCSHPITLKMPLLAFCPAVFVISWTAISQVGVSSDVRQHIAVCFPSTDLLCGFWLSFVGLVEWLSIFKTLSHNRHGMAFSALTYSAIVEDSQG